MELFALLYFPHYCQSPFNQFHLEMLKTWRYGERASKRLRGAPRGYAKSTLVALIKPIHDVCYGLESYIVILSNTKPQAVGKLKDIRRELLENTYLVDDYGISFPSKKPGESQFEVFCQDGSTMFSAFGSGAEIRGIRFGHKRPTKIICDDVEHSEEVFNEEIRSKYESWYKEVISNMGTKSTNIEFVGTVLHPKALLKNLEKNPAYNSKVYRSIISWSDRQDLWDKWTDIFSDLENDNREEDAYNFYLAQRDEMLKGTKVLWPEYEDYYELMKQLIEKGRRAFMKEKQNMPLGADDAVFETFHYYREVEGGIVIESSDKFVPWDEFRYNAYGAMDPSTGQTKPRKGKMGDYTCLLAGYLDTKGRLLVHEDWTKRAPPTRYIDRIFEAHEQYEFQKFAVETNLYRNLLLPNIIAERKRREDVAERIIKLPFYDIENVDNKEKRIFTLEPKTTHGWILFNRALSEEFMTQLEDFPHADHDDCPDTLEMLWSLTHKRYKASDVSVDLLGAR